MDLCKKYHVHLIATEQQYSDTAAQNLKTELKKRDAGEVTLVRVDPLEAATHEELSDPDFYVKKMTREHRQPGQRTEMNADLVTIRDLCVDLGGNSILKGVNAGLARGRITALIGLNGSGKSTLLRALVKEAPYRGTDRLPLRPRPHQTDAGTRRLCAAEAARRGQPAADGVRPVRPGAAAPAAVPGRRPRGPPAECTRRWAASAP